MKRQTLKIDYDYDFTLLGIVFHGKDYRLCFEINKIFSFELKKEEDKELELEKQGGYSFFSFYTGEDENGRMYFLLVNKGTGGFLLPEQKQIDFFLMIKGNTFEDEKKEVMKNIKQIPGVMGVYEIPLEKLKSKDNLLFF